MSDSNLTTSETDYSKLRYYKQLDKHIRSLSEKVWEKSVIKQNFYNDIVRKLEKMRKLPSRWLASMVY